MKVTLYKNGITPGDPVHVLPEEVLDNIKTGKYKDLIDKLNSYVYDSKEQDQFKKTKLPAIGWNGVFTYRANDKLIEHSGLVAIDFDKIPDQELEKYIDILKKDPYTFALFRSPRRNGLKCIVRIPAEIENHRYYVRGLRKHYGSIYYDHFEDESRLCYVSHDPDLYFNSQAKEWTTKDMAEEYKNQSTTNANQIENTEEISDISHNIFDMLIRWELNRNNHYQDNNKYKYLVSLYSGFNRFGVPQTHAAELAKNKFLNFPNTKWVDERDFFKIAESVYKTYPDKHNTAKYNPAPKYKLNGLERPEIEKMMFPIDVFPSDCQNFIKELNRTLKYNMDFISISIMFVFATLNGNKFKLKVKNGWNAPTIFWFMAVGEPGTMKTHPLNSIIKPISLIDKQNKALYDNDIKEWEMNGSTGKKPRYKQTLLSDYTLEALHEVHSYNKRGLGLYKDEIVGFLNDMNKYRKGSDEQFWLESFNNQSYQINRVSKDPIRLDEIMINIIGSIQPAVLANVAKTYHGNGLIDRFLYTAAEENIYPMGTDDINPGWFTWWEGKVQTANNWFNFIDEKDGFVIDMTPETMAEMIAADADFVKMQTSEDETNEIKNYLSKMKTYIPRFALLLALIDCVIEGSDLNVSPEHLKRARKICDYFINSARYVFSEADKSEEIGNVKRGSQKMTKVEQIQYLFEKGYKNKDIAKELKTPTSYVSKVIGEYNKKVIHNK